MERLLFSFTPTIQLSLATRIYSVMYLFDFYIGSFFPYRSILTTVHEYLPTLGRVNDTAPSMSLLETKIRVGQDNVRFSWESPTGIIDTPHG